MSIFWFCLKPCNSAKYMKTNFRRGPVISNLHEIHYVQCYSIWLGPKHIKLHNFLLADNFNAPLGFIKSSDLWEYPPEFTRWAPTSYKWSYGAPYKLGFEPHLRDYKFGERSELWLPEIWGVFSNAYRPNMSMTCPNCLAPYTQWGCSEWFLGAQVSSEQLTLVICVFFGGIIYYPVMYQGTMSCTPNVRVPMVFYCAL